MSVDTIDVLMITYNRPAYTKLALSRLLETCDANVRVWIWQNGSDPETLAVVNSLARHRYVHQYHHSIANQRLRAPTNWLFESSTGEFLSKVDDDCLLPYDWAQRLRAAHKDEPNLGVVGCWRFQKEDFVPSLAERKIRAIGGGHKILENCWVEGSGYLMKRACVKRAGLIREGESFTSYCVRLALDGWINGWYYPFLEQEHMDDPRAPHSLLKSDADLAAYLPLSAKKSGVTSIEQWTEQLRHSARIVQAASTDPRAHTGWRRRIRSIANRIRMACGGSRYIG